MTLQQLRYAIAISEAGSFNKAADALFIAQPSLTISIKKLEKEMGVALFIRNGRGTTPTKEGLEFLAYAHRILDETQKLSDHFNKKKKK